MVRSKVSEHDVIARAEGALRHVSRETAESLIRLIREVNPTERGLAVRDEAQRYRLKSALQSALVERFSSDLELVPADSPGFVGFRHCLLDASACHAKVDELSDQARSWVHLQLDLAQAVADQLPSAAAHPSNAPSSKRRSAEEPEDSMEAGHRALADFDFDRARQAFERALARDPMALGPAQSLLELLVDHLAADAEALELARRLPRPVQQEPAVRVVLARAAVRSGDVVHSLRLLQGLEIPEAAEVLALCGLALVAGGEVEQARRLLFQAKSVDPLMPALVALEAALRDHEGAERRGAENSLCLARERGDVAAADAVVRQILGRWPRSEPALEWVRQRSTEQAEERAQELLRQVEAAAGIDALNAALVALQAAQSPYLLPATRQRVEAALAEARTRVSAHESELRVERVRRALAVHDGTATLRRDTVAAWLALDPQERARATPAEEGTELKERLDWLERLGERLQRRLDVAIPLAETLAEASRYAASHPERALQLLEPHALSLSSCPPAQRLFNELREQGIATRRAQARLLLGQASQVYAEADLPAARALLQQSLPNEAEAEVRHAWTALRERVRQESEIRALEATFEEHVRAERWLEARDTLDIWMGSVPEPQREALELRRRELIRRIELAFHVLRGEGPLERWWVSAVDTFPADEMPMEWLRMDRDTLYIPILCDTWVLLVEWDWTRKTVVRWTRYAVPESMEEATLRVDARSLTLVGANGCLLELALDTGEPVRWRPALPAEEGAVMEKACLSRDGRYLWTQKGWRRETHHDGFVEIMDLQRGTQTRVGNGSLCSVAGSCDGAFFIVDENNAGTVFYDARGRSAGWSRELLWMNGAVVHPSGQGVVAMVDDGEKNQFLIEIRGQERTEHLLDRDDGEGGYFLATARASASTFQWRRGTIHPGLTRWEWLGGKLRPWETVFCNECLPVIDADSQQVVLLVRTCAGLDAITAENQCSPEGGLRRDLPPRPPSLAVHLSADSSAKDEEVLSPVIVEQAQSLRANSERWEPDMDAVDDAVSVLERAGHWQEAQSWRHELLGRLAQHPNVRLQEIERHWEKGDQEAFLTTLQGISHDSVSARSDRQYKVLKAWAAAIEGQFEVACSWVVSAGAHTIPDEVLSDLAVAWGPLEQFRGITAGPLWSNSQVVIAQYREALAQANQLLNEGSGAGVHECFASWIILYDEQALARCAEAALRVQPESPEHQIRAEWALARYVASTCQKYGRFLRITPETWSGERLVELAARAQAELKRYVGSI